MAFFGLTNLGYQNPIGDNMLVNPRGASLPPDVGINNKKGLDSSLQEKQEPLRCTETCNFYHQPAPNSSEIHHGSHERYKEMVKRLHTPRAPNELYIMPLTDSQQYGWKSSESLEPWAKIKRFPRKYSDMTKFVKEMSMKNPDFRLF
ncbi:testis-expressed protein 49-like [Notolabrus celidotus]|uniref:testis-expressed protein 49-like n=1 Tax=Notolabrus celidotus TaxID=1203425 RepID=UPI0014904220|nr:testis-expressed protein 49-like [Notolabrus celidotus]